MSWEALGDVAALSILVAAAVTLVMLLLRKWQDAAISFLVTVICCFAVLGFGNADARSKGFEDLGQMQVALQRGYTNPVAWRQHVVDLQRAAATSAAEAAAARPRAVEAAMIERAAAAADQARAQQAAEAAARREQGPTVNFLNGLPAGVRDVSSQCRTFQEDARYAQEQADRMSTADLRHGWESNRDTSMMLYRSTCQ